jgi:hypothetical protein
MASIPITLRTISIKKTPKRYYTGYVNDKYHVYSFSNREAASDCAFFIAQYKSRYGQFPDINQSEKVMIKNNLISPLYQKSILSILEEELVIREQNTNELINICSNGNIGLLIIYNFDFVLSNSKIDVTFSASSIIPENVNKNIYLDKLLNESD